MPYRPRGLILVALPVWAAGSALLVFAGGCADLKTASPNDLDPMTGDGSSWADGGQPESDGSSPSPSDGQAADVSNPPGKGPGPHGSLPSGYCCTSDSECRYRHCAETPRGKMCLDECYGNGICTHAAISGFVCDNGGSTFESGYCKPPDGFACIPQAKFERGKKLPGACCTPTGDGNAGLECEGSMCVSLNDGPFVCSNSCNVPTDCSGPFICRPITTTRKSCVPANDPYTCE